MTWPTYEPSDLATFTGDPNVAQLPFATQAIAQASLLLRAATCLFDIPADADVLMADMVKSAILSMADTFILRQPYREVVANPFMSETIGSYSYSKPHAKQVAMSVTNGQSTGDLWFDMVVNRYGACDASLFASGGIAVFEYDGIFVPNGDDHQRLLGPSDLNREGSVRDYVAPLFDSRNEVIGGAEEVIGGGEEIIWDDPDNPEFVVAP